MREAQVVHWLLTLGLVVVTLAVAWRVIEVNAREVDGGLLQTSDVPDEPRATLVDRIRASWEPGDRLRTALVLGGLALCATGAWRAWRVEGLARVSLRPVALTWSILGASCLALGVLRARALPGDGWSGASESAEYVYSSARGTAAGALEVDGKAATLGEAPLLAVGALWLGLGLVLGLLSLLYPPRAPDASPARSTPRGGGG